MTQRKVIYLTKEEITRNSYMNMIQNEITLDDLFAL